MKQLLLVSMMTCLAQGQAVTYDLSPGRFGDSLISYIHAKWVAYKYNLPLLYKPFIYSDKLVMHDIELSYAAHAKNFRKTVYLGRKRSVEHQDETETLYVVPYFPESKWELKNGISFTGGRWDYIEVDWKDKDFIQELRKVIAPRKPLTPMALPADRIAVAIHVRKGGNHDTPATIPGFPLKFLPEEFYIKQLKGLYYMLGQKPLYVYLFTDDNNPVALMNKFQDQTGGFNIVFDCRRQGNMDTRNVVEDFFSMGQFDCLLHSESNYSLVMSKIGNYMVTMFPDSYRKENGHVVYDHINTTINHRHKKFL